VVRTGASSVDLWGTLTVVGRADHLAVRLQFVLSALVRAVHAGRS